MDATQEVQEVLEKGVTFWGQFYGNIERILTYLRENSGDILWNVLAAVIILLLAKGALYLMSCVTKHVMNQPRYHRNPSQGKRVDTLMTLLRSIARYLIYFIAILLILNQFNMGSPAANLLATAGLGSLAIGFGAKNLVQDVVTGLFLMFENQFSVGDYIKVDDAEGTVQATAMRVTYLRSLKGDQIIIPNGTITRVINYTRGGYVASITISTAYEADTRQVIGVIEQAVQEYADRNRELVEENPVVLGINAFGASSVDIGVVCKVRPMKQWEVERGMRLAVKEKFDELGVEFPYSKIVTLGPPPPAEKREPVIPKEPPPPDKDQPDWVNADETDDDS